MSDFQFSLDDIMKGDNSHIIREMTKFQIDPKTPFKTTRSTQEDRNPMHTLDAGKIMMGIPAFNDGEHILGFQEQTFSWLTGAGLAAQGKDDGTTVGRIGVTNKDGKTQATAIDYLVPDDLRRQTIHMVQEIGDSDHVGYSDDKVYDFGGSDARDIIKGGTSASTSSSGGTATGAGGSGANGGGGATGGGGGALDLPGSGFISGSGSSTSTAFTGYTPEDHKVLATLLSMPGFLAAYPPDSGVYKSAAAGEIKAPLIKCLAMIHQKFIIWGGQVFSYRKKAGGGKSWSNHAYRAAIDTFAISYVENPKIRYSLSTDKTSKAAHDLYDFINSFTGFDRPDEVGITRGGWPESLWGPNFFYDPNPNHLHIGFNYIGDPTPSGFGGTRNPRWK